MNTVIRLVDPQKATLVILDNLGWYCDVANIFIRQRQSKTVPDIFVIEIEESFDFVVRIIL